jgi:hypothetical protein
MNRFFGGQITVETVPVSTVYIQEQDKATKSETFTNMGNKNIQCSSCVCSVISCIKL